MKAMAASETAMPPGARRPLPDGWKWVRLRELIREAQAGFACGARDPEGVIQLRMNNVDTRGNLVWNEVLRVPADAGTVQRFQLISGDVMFNNTNSTELVGKSALFCEYDEPVVYSNHFTRLRTKQNVLLPPFLAAWLNHQWHLGLFAGICNRWIGQSAVKGDMLLSQDFSLPPIPEQERIVAKLREQMAAVEKARTAAQARREAACALPAAFIRHIFPRPDQPLPEGWRWVKLGEASDGPGQYGTSTKSNGDQQGLPVLGMSHIHDGRIRWENVFFVDLPRDELRKYLLRRGDLLFNRTNSAELVGKSAVYDTDTPAVFASYLIRFRFLEGAADPHFVAVYINSREGRSFIEKNMARAIGQVNISASTMRTMPLPLPALPLQRRISSRIDEQVAFTDSARAAAEAELNTINALPAALLRRAFNGEL